MRRNTDPNLKAFLAEKAREEWEEGKFSEDQFEDLSTFPKLPVPDPNLKAFLAEKAREELELSEFLQEQEEHLLWVEQCAQSEEE